MKASDVVGGHMNIARLAYVLCSLLLLTGLHCRDLFDGNDSEYVVQVGEEQLPSLGELSRRLLFTERKLLVIYGSADAHWAKAYEQTLPIRMARWKRTLDVTIKPDTAVTTEDLETNSVFLVGTPRSNTVLAKMKSELPITFQDPGFVFHNKWYQDSTDVITFMYPNPANVQYPLFVTTGLLDSAVLQFMFHGALLGSDVGDYEIFRQGQLLLYGRFSSGDGAPWSVDTEQHHDFELDAPLALETEHYRYYVHKNALTDDALEAFIQDREDTHRRIRNAFGMHDSLLSKIEIFIFARAEEKGFFLAPVEENTIFAPRPQFVNYAVASHQIHIALEEDIGEMWPRETILLARRALGKPKTAILETGMGVYLSRDWKEQGYAYWASRLYLSGFVPSLQALLDNEVVENDSPYIVEPIAGTLVAFLIDTWGRAAFLSNYAHWVPPAGEIQRLERAWHTYLQQIATDHRVQIREDRAVFPTVTVFQKGFNYTQGGTEIYIRVDNGYASRRSDQSLERLKAIGANAVAIVPYTSMQDPHQPSPLLPHRDYNNETDDGIIHALLTAKRLGMSVMLKPQIQGGIEWAGFIEMKSEADWDLFFQYYERWILHYALMAEMYQVEILCVGTELSIATLAHEDRWTGLVEKLRSIYSGQMTYAANWGEEFENVRFWDAFDLIGLNDYYPLSDKDNPTDEELRRGADSVLARIEAVHHRYKKPVLFSEIGYASVQAPWKQPHDKRSHMPTNLEHQARSYAVMLQSLADKSWVRGIYWWRWPLVYINASDPFTPNRKPAERIVEAWYKHLGTRN